MTNKLPIHRLSMNPRQQREQAPRTPNAAAPGSRARNFAKRLECVQLAGAFGSWSRCALPATWRLPMNLPLTRPSVTLSAPHEPAAKAGASSTHSKRCRAVSTSRRFAQRLECVQLAGFRFMVPMRDCKTVDAFHEPRSAGVLAGEVLLSQHAGKDAGAPKNSHCRFMAPIRARC